ncbi:MAG: RND transporter [Bacteroidota bacterium]
MGWLDQIPLWALIVGAVLLGLAPFTAEPHLWQKLQMLADGTLSRPIDIFDLAMHAALPLLLALRLVRMALPRRKDRRP